MKLQDNHRNFRSYHLVCIIIKNIYLTKPTKARKQERKREASLLGSVAESWAQRAETGDCLEELGSLMTTKYFLLEEHRSIMKAKYHFLDY